ncbi:MAG: molybdopterin-dependent oxidoreductase [Bauldia sp.]|nr:molybdopterin-dependent oxidoreductase [Bauldia sp.]
MSSPDPVAPDHADLRRLHAEARHLTGRGAFTADLEDPPGTLHLAIGRSSVSAGRITRLDLDEARKSAGVVAILTADDIPARRLWNAAGDLPLIASGEVGFHGEVLFIVVAETRPAARRATLLARIGTSPSIPLTDLDDAIAHDATLLPDQTILRGNAATEIQRCDRRLIGQLRIGGQAHFDAEPHVAVAVPDAAGGVMIRASTEDPQAIRHVVAAALDIDMASVTVETGRIGGLAGSRRSGSVRWAALAALAAMRTGRPCKLQLDRTDDLAASGPRPDFRISYSVGFTDTGLVKGVDLVFAGGCGRGLDAGPAMIDRAMLNSDNAYFYPSFRIAGRRMRSNSAPAGSFRGAGAEGVLAAERIMDHIACSLGVDPLDVRKASIFTGAKDRSLAGLQTESAILGPLLNELERTSVYRKRRKDIAAFNQSSPILKRGIAIVPLKYGVGSAIDNDAAVAVALEADGSIRVAHSGAEAGQGLERRIRLVVANEFGISPERVVLSEGAPPATGPSSTDQVLLAAIDACRTIRAALHDFIEETMHVDRERVEFRDGQMKLGHRSMSFADLAGLAAAARVRLAATGTHRTGEIDWDTEKATGRPFHYHTYAAACAEVTIDVMTGERRIDRVDILHDVGRPIDPAGDTALVEAGFMLGVGWLTTEEIVHDSAATLMTGDSLAYLVPTIADLPADFRVAFFQSGGNREETAWRSKDIADAAILPSIAVFCAISDAIGSLRPGTMPRLAAPATPEAVMRAIRALADGEV